jgi:hypothetical protein
MTKTDLRVRHTSTTIVCALHPPRVSWAYILSAVFRPQAMRTISSLTQINTARNKALTPEKQILTSNIF